MHCADHMIQAGSAYSRGRLTFLGCSFLGCSFFACLGACSLLGCCFAGWSPAARQGTSQLSAGDWPASMLGDNALKTAKSASLALEQSETLSIH